MNFEVNEESIAKVMSLPVEGERWFKKHLFGVDLSLYLLLYYEIEMRSRVFILVMSSRSGGMCLALYNITLPLKAYLLLFSGII